MQADRKGIADDAELRLGVEWVAANAIVLGVGNTLFIAAHYADLVWPTRTLWPVSLASFLGFALFGLAQALFLGRLGLSRPVWVVRTALAGSCWTVGALLSPSVPSYWREYPGTEGLHWPDASTLEIAVLGTVATFTLPLFLGGFAVAMQSAGLDHKLSGAWLLRSSLGWYAIFLLALVADDVTGPQSLLNVRLMATAGAGLLGGACFGLLTAPAFRKSAAARPALSAGPS